MTVRLTNIQGTNADPDLYVSCNGTDYTSTNPLASDGEAVQFVAPAGATAYIEVRILQPSSSNTWSIETRTQQYNPTIVVSNQVYERSFKVGYRDYFHLSVPEGLHKVAYSYKTSEQRNNSNAQRDDVDLSVEIPENVNAQDYKVFDATSQTYRTMIVHDKESKLYRLKRGNALAELEDIRFIYGPRLVKIYASSSLKLPTVTETEESIKFEFKATITKADTLCHNLMTGSIARTQTLSYNDMRFYSVRVDGYERFNFTYAQLVLTGKSNQMNVHASSTAEYPMYNTFAAEFFYRGDSCGSPKTCIKTFNFRDLNEIASASKPGACTGSDVDTPGAKFIHFSVQAAQASGTSEYELALWGTEEGCSWRPDCKSCAQGTNDDCKWCQGFAGTCANPPCRGYCAGAAEILKDSWPATQKTCAQTFSCEANDCSSKFTCDQCREKSGCGWCAAQGEKGQCVRGDSEGPLYTEGNGNIIRLGICGKWAFGANVAACDEACAVHDRHPNPCEACSQETNCGYCKTSLLGGCVAGSGSKSTNGECPREDALWASTIAQCVENNLLQIPTGKEVKSDGAITEISLDKNALICALGSCPSEILRYEIPSTMNGPHDIRATIRTLASVEDRKRIHVLASLDEVPTLENHMAKGIIPPVELSGDEMFIQFGLCGDAKSIVYFVVMFDETQGGSSTLEVTFKLDILPSTIIVQPKNVTGFEETKTLLTLNAWMCCGQSRHFSMPMPTGMESAQTHVSIVPKNSPNFALLSRRGTCPSLGLADVVARNGTVTSAMETVEDMWYITVAANNSFMGYQNFDLYGWSDDIPREVNSWFDKYFWYALGGGCGALVLFICACIRGYRIKSKYKKRLNDQVSNALAMHKSFKGFGDVENAENAVAVIQAASEAEEQLVDLIMDLQTKVATLEEDRNAKEDVARMTGGMKKNSNNKSARKPPKGGSAPSLASVEEDNVLDPISPSVIDRSKKVVSDWDISDATGESAPAGAKYSFEILCPDGSIMEITREKQTLGRGIAGITSKKISREQCMLSVNFESGKVEIETLGKNPMASKKPGMSVWESLESAKRRDVSSGDKFMLLSPDTMLREGISDETAFVFTLKVSRNPLRRVYTSAASDEASS
jgi:hypothetical protein